MGAEECDVAGSAGADWLQCRGVNLLNVGALAARAAPTDCQGEREKRPARPWGGSAGLNVGVSADAVCDWMFPQTPMAGVCARCVGLSSGAQVGREWGIIGASAR